MVALCCWGMSVGGAGLLMAALCYWGVSLQVVKCIVMVGSRWCWVVDGGAVSLGNMIAGFHGGAVELGNVIAGS